MDSRKLWLVRTLPPDADTAGAGLRQGAVFIGRYRLERRLGRGGMGEAWIATDLALERAVAIKFIHPRLSSAPAALARFVREMRSLARVAHPNIVRLYDSGVEPQPHMIMELVQGATVREIISTQGRIEPVTAVCYALQIAEGLGAAHRAKLSHRDVKPENLIVSDDGRGHVWILDFGIARRTDDRSANGTTDRLGTLGYMPPEVALSEPTDHRGDLYQLGVVLYEMVAGRLPYGDVDVSSETEMQAAHAYLAPDPIPAIVPECPEPLWDVVARLLAKRPEQRYPSADAVMTDLRGVLRASAPPDAAHPLARAVHRELVQKKLDGRRPARSVAPAPGAASMHEPTAQRATSPLLPGFTPPSPYATSPSPAAAETSHRTASLPPDLTRSLRAPYPMPAPRAARNVAVDRVSPRAWLAWALATALALTATVTAMQLARDARSPFAGGSASVAAPASSAPPSSADAPTAAPTVVAIAPSAETAASIASASPSTAATSRTVAATERPKPLLTTPRAPAAPSAAPTASSRNPHRLFGED